MRTIPMLLLAAALHAQGSGAAGRVLDVDGRPVAGAAVVLLHRPLACPLELEPAHRAVATTDASGMFRAALQPHCRYSVSARWNGGASRIEEAVEAGSFVELRQDPLAVPRTVAVSGLEAHAARAPFRLQVSVGSEQLELLSVPVQDARAELPALPYLVGRTAELTDRSGEVLWAATLGDRFELPPPRTLRIAVRSAAGEPIAGVELRRHLLNHWYTHSAAVTGMERFRCLWPRLGTTGADGRLELQLPVAGDAAVPPQHLVLLASKPGLQACAGGYYQGRPVQEQAGDMDAASEAVEVTFTLPAAAGSELGNRPGLPLAAAIAVVRWRVHLRDVGLPLVAPVPWQQGLRLPAMPARCEVENAWLPLAADLRQQLAGRFGFWPPAGFQPRQPAQLGKADSQQFDADDLLALRVVTADGRPAERVAVLATWPDGRAAGVGRTERLGRILLPRSARASVLDASGFGSVQLGSDDDGGQPVLELRPLQRREVRVRAANGTAAAGCVLRIQGWDAAGPDGSGMDGDGSVPTGLLSYLLAELPPLRSDAAGVVQLALPPFAGVLRLQAFADGRELGNLQLAIDDGRAPLTLELPPAGG